MHQLIFIFSCPFARSYNFTSLQYSRNSKINILLQKLLCESLIFSSVLEQRNSLLDIMAILSKKSPDAEDIQEGADMSRRVVSEFEREMKKRIVFRDEFQTIIRMPGYLATLIEPVCDITAKILGLVHGIQVHAQNNPGPDDHVAPIPNETFFTLVANELMAGGNFNNTKWDKVIGLFLMVLEQYVVLKIRHEPFDSITRCLEYYLVNRLKLKQSEWEFFAREF